MTESDAFWSQVGIGLLYLQKLFILVGVVIFMTIPKKGRRQYLELGLMLFVFLVQEISTTTLRLVFHTSPNPANNIGNLFVLPLAVLFYRHRLDWRNKNIISIIVIATILSFGLFNLFSNGIATPNSYTFSLEAFCFMILSVSYFYLLLRVLPTESLTTLPMFWINTGFLIYYSSNFTIYLSTEYLVKVAKSDMLKVWIVHNFFGLIFYSILWYAMLLIRSEYRKALV